jgi:hypothetical protein
MWENFSPYPLTRENLLRLINNEIPVIRIPNFAPQDQSEELALRFMNFANKSNSVATVTRMGISQYEQGIVAGKANYFSLVEEAWANLEKACETTFNPVTKMIDTLRQYFESVEIMEEPNFGRYFAGVAKLRTGHTPMHSDFPLFGADDWGVAAQSAQLSWNFYLRVPEEGGELKVWDKFWQEEHDEQYLVKGTYYHDEAVVADVPSITIKPIAGEVMLLNARNYHTVLPCENRVAIGSWISQMPDDSLKLWS